MKKEKLYLGEIMERDMVNYGSNNMILSPTGSGKSHFIMNDLVKRYNGKKLMLVSTASLKDSLEGEDNIFTSQDLRRKSFSLSDESVYVMSYAEFGMKIGWNDKFISDYSVIFCDEIHSLFDYFFMGNSYKLTIVILSLFKKHDNLDIFYFTATDDKINSFIRDYNNELYDVVSVFNYIDNEDILRYTNDKDITFSNDIDIEHALLEIKKLNLNLKCGNCCGCIDNSNCSNIKGIAFSERIKSMDKLASRLSEHGYSSISIWSINNEDHIMNNEQLRVRDMMLNEGVLPDEYDFVIINESMREGYNINDKRLNIVLSNTTDETNTIQSRGRARKDIALMLKRVLSVELPIDVKVLEAERLTGAIYRNIGIPLDANAKNEICKELNVKRESDGKIVKWTTISKVLINAGYIIKNSRKIVNGKQVRVSLITLRNDSEVAPVNDIEKQDKNKSISTKASIFIGNLDKVGFTEANKVNLDKYLSGKGRKVAFSHIRSSYKALMPKSGWNERKFADITYIIAKRNDLYIEKTYTELNEDYEISLSELDKLRERAKYESKANEQVKVHEDEISKDLLEHIANNGGKY